MVPLVVFGPGGPGAKFLVYEKASSDPSLLPPSLVFATRTLMGWALGHYSLQTRNTQKSQIKHNTETLQKCKT